MFVYYWVHVAFQQIAVKRFGTLPSFLSSKVDNMIMKDCVKSHSGGCKVI